ncbi:unnamed protein product [Parascedosporium putredinis]|uniref:Uncharacterized protein n=1 Tax=Parascedosporium putredinis TaxID=1442378 RepID=A0A9P1H7C7_9PEZI|nr:unnamed protein product [Parascedosporium putredinis]CAI7998338.1 unnamed protein product [Parascedosporium putredinis]
MFQIAWSSQAQFIEFIAGLPEEPLVVVKPDSRPTYHIPSLIPKVPLSSTLLEPHARNGVKEEHCSLVKFQKQNEFYFQDRLDDVGLVRILATDLHLRDVVQAMRYIRDRMWTAVPERASGMNSTRIADVLNYRRRTPPVVTLAHLQAVLASPTAVEREVAELLSKGIVRRVLVGKERGPHRVLGREQVDELVRAGFLTSLPARMHGAVTGSPAGSAALTRGLLGSSMSLEHVAKAPTGSLGAVGGRAINMVTGKGTPTSSPVPRSQRAHPVSVENIAVSAPGHGGFLKLHKAALEHLLALLDKRSAFREMPESLLREAWDGGLAAAGARAPRERGASTRAWRQARQRSGGTLGPPVQWVLEEAVGAGVVELSTRVAWDAGSGLPGMAPSFRGTLAKGGRT